MSLDRLSIPAVLTTSSNSLIDDLFIPALGESIHYDRGVGFFSSGWFRLAAKGMTKFASNGGYARWITSPILDESDWQALIIGDQGREDILLYELLKKNISDLSRSLEEETLSAIAWMIADNIIDIKLAIPINKLDRGEFHDKFGIFYDDAGNKISFIGSYNDTIQGTVNYESIKVFCSWMDAYSAFVESDVARFQSLWDNSDPNVRVLDLPAAAKENILKLRKGARPYRIGDNPQELFIKSARPSVPTNVILRDYQRDAIQAWVSNGRLGILEMATGTGKTITSLAAAVQTYEYARKIALAIIVPYKHLVEQWANELEKFDFRPVRVAESSKKWEPELTRQVQAFRMGLSDNISLVATNSALERGNLQAIFSEIWPESLLIVDEVHHAGAPGMLTSLPKKVPWKLGLSATPVRHYDEIGSDALIKYFGEIIFEFGLDKAIGTFLTPYYYYPIPIEMTDEEFGDYRRLTRQLGKYIHSSESEMPDAAKMIAIKRARLLNNSVAKLIWLENNIQKYQKIKYTLFYVGESLFEPTKRLLGIEKRLRIHEFTQRQNNAERTRILEEFANGELQALIAMKCLDEGVDVPPTREAFFLASSGNPREFIQRRGRVLRLSPEKEFAIIRDLISIPPLDFIRMGRSHPDFSAVRSSFLREYRRVKEFAQLAINHYQAIESMFEIGNMLQLLDN